MKDKDLLKELASIVPASKESDERTTPDELFKPLDDEFHFTLDPCATHENTKCKRHYTLNENGLLQSWRDEIVFMNPPYSNIKGWLYKVHHECWSDGVFNKIVVVCILPCDTSTKWFHHYLWNSNSHKSHTGIQLRFPEGRFKFGKYTKNPQFATIIAVFRADILAQVNDLGR